MKKKSQIRGNLYIQMPQPFRKQQMSLSSQKKDKEIRLKLEELNRKTNEYQELEQRWLQQKQNYEQFLNYHVQQDKVLRIREQSLRKQVFKLSIRKQQIESKTNPEISLFKMKKLVQYLKCVPFTLGNYYEKVIFWKGQREYLRYKFLFNYFVDRLLLRTEDQRYIKKNISNIVYCSKVEFYGEWIMVIVKIVDQQIESRLLLQQSEGRNKTSGNVFELSVYAISGKYFCCKKNYKQEQLEHWSDILQKNEREKRRHMQSKNKDENRRSSMAKILTANCCKEMLTHRKQNKSNHERCVQIQQDKIEADNFVISEDIDGKIIQEENQSQHNSHRQSDMHGWNQSSGDANNNAGNIYSEENSDCTVYRDQSVSSNDSCEQIEKTAQKESLSTKKNVKSKSFFYSETKYSQNRFKTLNKHFLRGGQQFIFPQTNPLLNIVILKEHNEIYLLQDYLQIKQKLQIINIALSRYRLKMKMKKQLRKCLFYKVIQFEDFYETKLKYQDKITLPIIFMVKKTDQKHKQLKLSCTALAHHPSVQNSLNFLHTFYRQKAVVEKVQLKESRRISNNKPIKNSGCKSKQAKKRTISKYMLKAIEHQKSAFHLSKTQNSQLYAVNVRQKFDQFLRDNVISIQRQCFIGVEKLKSLSRCLIRLQSILRKKIQLRKYRQAKKQIVYKYKYFPAIKVLLTARTSLDTTQSVKVVLQSLEQCMPLIYKRNTYLHKYKNTIFEIIEHFQLQQRSQHQYINLEQQIKLGIQLQDQQQAIQLQRKPAKQRAALVRFLRMSLIRKKRKANIYFIKKTLIKDRVFLLIIRRNNRIRSLLQCNLYDFAAADLKLTNSRDKLLEMNCFKIQYPCSNKQFSYKPYLYQKIHLHERYFEGIERKAIADQFLIDYRVFLLKPAKQPSIHFIERICPFDINYEDINKELAHIQREEKQNGSHCKNSSQLSHLVSNKSFKNSSTLSNDKKSNGQLLNIEKQTKRQNLTHLGHQKLHKNTSMLQRNKELPNSARQHFTKDYRLQHTAQSVQDSTAQKSKRFFKITGNSHESIIYFSLYKAKDIFFYLDIYLVSRQQFQRGYGEQLELVSTNRIYKKQLEELGNQIIIKKIAEWLHINEERLVQMADNREKNEEMESKIQLEGGLNMMGRCLQFLDTDNKRFSQTIAINLQELLLEKQRGRRKYTFNL